MNEMGLAQSSPIGTIAYFSPELVRDPPAPSTIQGDMWALGISLIETIIGEHPCAVSNYTERLSTLSTWNREILEGMIPDDIREFILQLLAIEAEQRPDSYAEILEMSFIRDLHNEPTDGRYIFIITIIRIIHESDT
ncbi:unnamed protein product [Rotaria sordida]|nr:unnamed protein product [Rotaria sordida]CAF3950659.1 unnamed protein product [Rotaria sordida]CAF3970897.1 unnamed protein product [Rotaria sordida]